VYSHGLRIVTSLCDEGLVLCAQWVALLPLDVLLPHLHLLGFLRGVLRRYRGCIPVQALHHSLILLPNTHRATGRVSLQQTGPGFKRGPCRGVTPPHLGHSPGIHVVPISILNHLFGQVHIDSLFMTKTSKYSTPSRPHFNNSLCANTYRWVTHLLVFAIVSPELLDVDHGVHAASLVHPPYCSDALVLCI